MTPRARVRLAALPVAVGVAVAVAGCGQPPRLDGPALPDQVLQLVRGGKGFQVVRLGNPVGADAVGRPVFAGRELLGAGRADALWRGRFDSLLAIPAWQPASASAPSAAPASACFGVRYAGVGHAVDVVVDMERGTLELGEDGVVIATRAFGGDAGPLRQLARQAFPSDSLLTRTPPGDTARLTPPAGYLEQLPEPAHVVRPQYPRAAVGSGVTGVVLLQVNVDSLGRVTAVRVSRSIPALDAAAIAAVRQWRFRPARSNGRPTSAWVAVPITFDRPR